MVVGAQVEVDHHFCTTTIFAKSSEKHNSHLDLFDGKLKRIHSMPSSLRLTSNAKLPPLSRFARRDWRETGERRLLMSLRPLTGSLQSRLKQGCFTLDWMSVRNPQGQEIQYLGFLDRQASLGLLAPLFVQQSTFQGVFSRLSRYLASCLELQAATAPCPIIDWVRMAGYNCLRLRHRLSIKQCIRHVSLHLVSSEACRSA